MTRTTITTVVGPKSIDSDQKSFHSAAAAAAAGARGRWKTATGPLLARQRPSRRAAIRGGSRSRRAATRGASAALPSPPDSGNELR